MKKEINNCMDCDNYPCILKAKSEKCKSFRMKRPKKKLIDYSYFERTPTLKARENGGKLMGYNQACDDWEKYHKEALKGLLEFIDGERIVGADTKKEQLIGQGRNQAFSIVAKKIKKNKR